MTSECPTVCDILIATPIRDPITAITWSAFPHQIYTSIPTNYFDFSCSDLDAHPGMPSAPRAMVNLETWVPSNFEVDDWQVEDVGPLGSGGRSVGIYDHVLFFVKT